MNDINYDVVVIGGGHAGCEAAAASARMGVNTAHFTYSLYFVGKKCSINADSSGRCSSLATSVASTNNNDIILLFTHRVNVTV